MKLVRSRIFLNKYYLLNLAEKNDIDKALKRIKLDPENNQFKRAYLTPYKQEHPSNKQLTIFFQYLKKEKIVFIAWVNDQLCLHDTRKKHGEDPCLVEFMKLKNNKGLEEYSKDIYEGKLKITPRHSSPSFFVFSVVYVKVHGNISKLDNDHYYCMGLVYEDTYGEDSEDLFNYHTKIFLESFYDHFKKEKQEFEFRIPPDYNEEIIGYLKGNYKAEYWEETKDDDLFILKKK